jgi:hypothetical protein
MSSDIRTVLDRHFPVTTSEHPFQLSSFLKLSCGLGQEDMTEGLREIKTRVLKNRDLNSDQGLGLSILRKAIGEFYSNPMWIEKQQLVDTPIDAHGIVERICPAMTVEQLRQLTFETLTKATSYRTTLLRELQACDNNNKVVIDILRSKDYYYVEMAKRINHYIPRMTTPRPIELTLPLGGATVGNFQTHFVERSDVDTLPPLSHEEIIRVVNLIERIGSFIDDSEHQYNQAWMELFIIDRDDFNPFEEAAKESSVTDKQYAAKIWLWLAKHFSGDRLEPLADLITERYAIVLSLTLWGDRSIK